jgi:hypothetical protein
MLHLSSLVFLLATLSGCVSGSGLGPVTDLKIVNEVLAPDGYSRMWVSRSSRGKQHLTRRVLY